MRVALFSRPMRLVESTRDFTSAVTPIRRPATAAVPVSEDRHLVVSRAAAMTVPAVKRARSIICGTIGTFNLAVWLEGRPVPPGTEDVTAAFLRRPQRDRTLNWLLTWTIDDLLFYDIAYWRIVDRRGLIPRAVERVETHKVSVEGGHYLVEGKPVPVEDMIAFAGSGVGGICLGDGARIVMTALELESAAWRYANAPQPQTTLINEGADLDDDEQDELLDTWETARRTRSTAYLNAAVRADHNGWTARELQLVEARQHTALEVARLTNLDAHYLNAPAASGMTYTNRQDIRRDLVDITLRPYTGILEQTLSVDNTHAGVGWQLATGGKDIALDPANFLRLNDLERAQLWTSLTGSDVLTVEEARGLEPLSPEGPPDA